ncbi:chromatin modification-related protein EAF7-domain-containing protein [Suillus clintonianus]|uniref:chromatin modification-related protein EAF7-domain-containing protein n=1 Tax=Suillus clintonianus TaxID=1904413 RepID=UPI001B87B8FB|nr:chromatin modification-related protein EAF7-domain-containing protein [Suillus clintonianus]KAG2129449.1 chromatin modification-related protein EAF7-domain-containing protein [Suillus clintonianus]
MSDSLDDFLDSVEGEITFFRSVMKARPVGLHKHFHVLAIRNTIHNETGRVLPVESIWAKLKTCYDLDALETAEIDGFDTPTSSQNSTPHLVRSPSPSQNLSRHPFFRDEYSLPNEDAFNNLVSERRIRATASLPSSTPAPSPRQPSKPKKTKTTKRSKSKADMAGLVGGDSDSSALTQESGDEGAGITPSVITGTDAGTDYEEDNTDVQDTSPGQSKAGRGRVKQLARGGAVGRARAGSASNARGTKKRKK